MSGRNFVVTVKESAEGKPWLLVEPDGDIGLEPRRHIAFELPSGATNKDAVDIKDALNRLEVAVRIVKL